MIDRTLTYRSAYGLLIGVLLALLPLAVPAAAQHPLVLVDDDTEVRNLSFRFVDTQTFSASRLQEQIATRSPGLLDRIQRRIPLLDAPPYPFDPIELQRDVVRLEHFYNRQGFQNPSIDYPATQYDSTSNTVHVIFTVEEGPPTIIQDVGFFAPDSVSYASAQFDPALRERWIQFRDRTTFRQGERYSDFVRTRIEDEVLRWLRNQGYAFADIDSEVTIDAEWHTADIRFFVDAGPRTRISEIQIEGNELVSERVIRREIPFQVGDYYSHDRLVEGQREIFSLQMFRVALADVPDQPRDSTVSVRYRLRESQPRYLSAETGYARNTGLNAEGQWTHRNFLGGARSFTVSALANTGFFTATTGRLADERLLRTSVTLRQPYLFTNRLTGIITPFIEFERNPLLASSEEPLGINAREFGVNTTLSYEIHPFRTVSLQHSYSRALQFTSLEPDPDEAPDDQLRSLRDLYNRNVFSLSGQLGQADDYIVPSRGFLVRPLIEWAPPLFGSGVEYTKFASEATAYLPVLQNLNVAGRLYAGRLFPFGESRQQETQPYRDRFNRIRFYTGGSNDLRGWPERMAGEKRVRRFITMNETGTQDTTYAYEPEGGLYKLAMNTELRVPFPGLGEEWRMAVFLDAGQTSSRLHLDDLRIGTGAGIRYMTPVGFIRLDFAYKLNPDFEDLRDPRAVYEWRNRDGPRPEPDWWRRFRIHLSIGQAF